MIVFNLTPKHLVDFKENKDKNSISLYLDWVINKIPEDLRLGFDFNNVELDYLHENKDVPEFAIPYKFNLQNCCEEISDIFNQYIILIRWA